MHMVVLVPGLLSATDLGTKLRTMGVCIDKNLGMAATNAEELAKPIGHMDWSGGGEGKGDGGGGDDGGGGGGESVGGAGIGAGGIVGVGAGVGIGVGEDVGVSVGAEIMTGVEKVLVQVSMQELKPMSVEEQELGLASEKVMVMSPGGAPLDLYAARHC